MTGAPPALALTAAVAAALHRHAAAAYPAECCGFLLGPGQGMLIDEAVPSANLAPDGGLDAFELDSALHLALQRRARDAGRRLIGFYHSHPGAAPIPSARDLAGAFDHDRLWLILGAGGAMRAWWPGVDGFQEAAIEVMS